ncbi:MAG: tetratricopeptide repeat protein [Caldilineaceae bacterium]|nr:tetratricopeptide repeat protein [Caldilineaceae bacterium]
MAPQAAPAIQADIHDALAGLHYYRHDTDTALHHMRAALSLREESGDLLGVAKSQTNMGLLFSALDDHAAAVAVYREALGAYQRLGNRELAAATLLNLGMAHHLMDERAQAILYYRETLSLCAGNNWHVTAARAQSNLAEAYAELGEVAPAQAAWQAGLTLARDAGLDDEVAYFVQLLEQFPALQGTAFTETGADSSVPTQANDATAAPQDFEAQQALQLARARGRVTTRELMEATGVSKATATRKLAALAEDGRLVKVGQGRNTHYVPPAQADDAAPTTTSADPRQVLRQQRVLLEHYYGITGLALLTPPAQVAWLELAAAFAELPDLLTFFALEARLARTLARPVRLRPLAALQDDVDAAALAQADWLWRSVDN